MRKDQRNREGAALKWRETRFGRRHYARLKFFRRAIICGIRAQSAARIEAIRSAPAKSTDERARKALAIGKEIITARLSEDDALYYTNAWFK